MKVRRLVLMQTRRIGETCVVRDYKEVLLRWVRHPISGQWVAMEGRKIVARVSRIHSTLWELDYAFSKSPESRYSGGCRRDTPEECKKVFEQIYTAGLSAWRFAATTE